MIKFILKSLSIGFVLNFLSLFCLSQDRTNDQQVHEKFPEFHGGEDSLFAFIKNNIHYPENALQNKTEGIVVVQFVIDTNGKVNNISVLKGINEELDKEAIRVVSLMSDWVPAEKNFEKIKVSISLPILFEINNHMRKRKN